MRRARPPAPKCRLHPGAPVKQDCRRSPPRRQPRPGSTCKKEWGFSWHFANKIRGLVGAAAALITGDLRVRAQRTRAIDRAVANPRCDDLLGRLALLHPMFERLHRVKSVRPIAAAAMPHPR